VKRYVVVVRPEDPGYTYFSRKVSPGSPDVRFCVDTPLQVPEVKWLDTSAREPEPTEIVEVSMSQFGGARDRLLERTKDEIRFACGRQFPPERMALPSDIEVVLAEDRKVTQ
jgi:hypothetical protein